MINRVAEREALLRRKKAERRKLSRRSRKTLTGNLVTEESVETRKMSDSDDEYDIEYVPEPIAAEYETLISKFAPSSSIGDDFGMKNVEYSDAMADILDADAQRKAAEAAASIILNDAAKMSNKERKINERVSLAALKATVERPDLVDGMDNCSSDPELLLFLKGYKNVVQVPSLWSRLGSQRYGTR